MSVTIVSSPAAIFMEIVTCWGKSLCSFIDSLSLWPIGRIFLPVIGTSLRVRQRQ
jgi:hypothetical protein